MKRWIKKQQQQQQQQQKTQKTASHMMSNAHSTLFWICMNCISTENTESNFFVIQWIMILTTKMAL